MRSLGRMPQGLVSLSTGEAAEKLACVLTQAKIRWCWMQCTEYFYQTSGLVEKGDTPKS